MKNNTKYPMVALFDLDTDPTESVNLAYDKPDLVRELLAEAEEIVENAPKQYTSLVSSYKVEFTQNCFDRYDVLYVSAVRFECPQGIPRQSVRNVLVRHNNERVVGDSNIPVS